MNKKLLLVCSGNTCRSPMAQGLLLKYIADLQAKGILIGYDVLSAGLYTIDGLPATPEALRVMLLEGIDISKHRSKQIDADLMEKADLILTMTSRHSEELGKQYPEKRHRIFSVGEFIGESAKEISDPYGRGEKAYLDSLQEIKGVLRQIIARASQEVSNEKPARGERMRIAIGSDHAGVDLKRYIIDFLEQAGFMVIDCGTTTYESVDYPDIAEKVAREVLAQRIFGILICGTGIGISIAANKIRGIRAANCDNIFTARLARLHNDANVLAIGSRVIGEGLALAIVENFIKMDFQAGRHQRRVEKIKAIEKKYLERG